MTEANNTIMPSSDTMSYSMTVIDRIALHTIKAEQRFNQLQSGCKGDTLLQKVLLD